MTGGYVMKRLNLVLTIMLLVMLSTTGAFAYVSDRHGLRKLTSRVHRHVCNSHG